MQVSDGRRREVRQDEGYEDDVDEAEDTEGSIDWLERSSGG